MYTVLVNKDKSLTTSVRESLIGDNTNTVQFLFEPLTASEASQSDSDGEPEQSVTYTYTADLQYQICGVVRAETLVTDEELYKERVRFILPSSAAFWNNRGQIQYWLDIAIETITTTRDEQTGQPVVERNIEYFVTLPTTLFIDEVTQRSKCKWQCHNPNTIVLTRGDSRDVKITLTDVDGYPYMPVEGDELWFTLKKTPASEDILLEKSIDSDTLTISFVEADTENFVFGEYRYEVELVTSNNDHYTVIKNTPFIITEELH